MTLSLTSPAFRRTGTSQREHPKEYICDGKDLAPPLKWSAAPAGTKSFALIVDDPDAPDPKAPNELGALAVERHPRVGDCAPEDRHREGPSGPDAR